MIYVFSTASKTTKKDARHHTSDIDNKAVGLVLIILSRVEIHSSSLYFIKSFYCLGKDTIIYTESHWLLERGVHLKSSC